MIGDKQGKGVGELDAPIKVAADEKNQYVWVTDSHNHRVQSFGLSDGKFVRGWGSKGTENGQFACPHGICLQRGTNHIIVTDTLQHCVQAFMDHWIEE